MKDRDADVPELISVIVTTYNREDALATVLASLSRQRDRGFEVVIADDGSRPATAAVVEHWRGRLGVPLGHVWQADCGFRAAEIRNRAILASRGGYCVFLDGDCIARPDFIATHRRLAQPGWFVTGNRVLLSAELTADVLRESLEPDRWRASDWIDRRWRGGVNRLAAVLRLPLGPLRRFGARQGRALCHRRDSPVASGGGPRAACRQRCPAGRRVAQRSRARAARAICGA